MDRPAPYLKLPKDWRVYDPLKGDYHMHIYHHPKLKPPAPLRPGDTVEQNDLPGVDLTVVSGPEAGLTGDVYRVLWNVKEVRVKRNNFKL